MPSSTSSQPTSLFTARLSYALATCIGKIRLFQPNARIYLLNTILVRLAYGAFRLLFNFFILSLDYDEVFLGRLLTISSAMSLAMGIGLLIAPPLADRWARFASS